MVNRYGDEASFLPTNSRGQRPLVAAGVLAPYRVSRPLEPALAYASQG